MKYKYILWDWNGTLLDDVKASLDAVNDMLEMYEKNKITLEDYYSYVDTPIYKFYEKIFDLNTVPMSVIKPLFARFYNNRKDGINLAENAEKLLVCCKEKGVKQYILSASHIDDVSMYAKSLGVYDLFEEIEAAKDYEAGSKIDRAKMLFESEKIQKNECVMVGDTLHDLETAKALGIDCILYSKGHTDFEKLKATGNVVCTSFDEIEKII